MYLRFYLPTARDLVDIEPKSGIYGCGYIRLQE